MHTHHTLTHTNLKIKKYSFYIHVTQHIQLYPKHGDALQYCDTILILPHLLFIQQSTHVALCGFFFSIEIKTKNKTKYLCWKKSIGCFFVVSTCVIRRWSSCVETQLQNAGLVFTMLSVLSLCVLLFIKSCSCPYFALFALQKIIRIQSYSRYLHNKNNQPNF